VDVLLDQPPWFVAWPLLGLIVVAVYATLGERLGVLGGFSELVERAAGARAALGWKAWFVVGIVAGGTVFAVASGGSRGGDGYGWLEGALGGEPLLVGAVLVGAGVLIGVGAKVAGGCTSGNGLSGCSFGSPASFVATGTFMGTAVATAFLMRALLG
jgi:uncharacterized protein